MLMIVIIVVLIVVIWPILITNKFNTLAVKIDEAASGIEVALTKRYDMLNKMLDTAKGYMKHEKDVFKTTISMRQGMSINDLANADNEMSKVTSSLLALAENYPELKSSDVFLELQKGIKDAEEHLQAARRVYNSNVSNFNQSLVIFPNKLFAGSRKPYDFYKAEDYKREDVKINF